MGLALGVIKSVHSPSMDSAQIVYCSTTEMKVDKTHLLKYQCLTWTHWKLGYGSTTKPISVSALSMGGISNQSLGKHQL